jgi:hypothetical protein
LGTKKSNKSNNTLTLPKRKKLGPLGACWLTSLAAKNFYANLSLFFFIIFGLGTQIMGHSQVTLLGYLTQINFGLL